jgi:hypothetical protein
MRDQKPVRQHSISISRNLEICTLKKIIGSLFLGAALLVAASASAQTFTNLNDIQYWVGSGTNQSALVISWNDTYTGQSGITPDSLVFGYNWNMPVSGTAPSVYNMLMAIESADTYLELTPVPAYSSPTNWTLYSAFYNLTSGTGQPVVGSPGRTGTEDGYAPAGDLYAEGWYTGYWQLFNATGDPYTSGTWKSSMAGLATDRLSNDSWNALSFDEALKATLPAPPDAEFAIPEPSCVVLTVAGIGILLYYHWLQANRERMKGVTGNNRFDFANNARTK